MSSRCVVAISRANFEQADIGISPVGITLRRRQQVWQDRGTHDVQVCADWISEAHVVGDAGDPEVLRRIFDTYNVSGVMHFAGSITLAESLTDPLKYYANNTGTSRRLLDACQANGVRSFVFSSSAAVYGNPSDIPVHEDAALLPISPYGASKMMTERMLIDLAALGGMNFAILRYFNVAGADPQCRSGQVSPQVTHLIRIAAEVVTGRRNEICIYGTDYATPDSVI